MTDAELETLRLTYALGEAIRTRDWASAGLMQERLLDPVAPLAPAGDSSSFAIASHASLAPTRTISMN